MPDQPVLFYSTNRTVPKANLQSALLQGQAADRGLFMPDRVPPLGPADLAALVGKTYPEIAHFVLRRFTAGVMEEETLRALCEDAYDFEVPLEPVADRRWLHARTARRTRLGAGNRPARTRARPEDHRLLPDHVRRLCREGAPGMALP